MRRTLSLAILVATAATLSGLGCSSTDSNSDSQTPDAGGADVTTHPDGPAADVTPEQDVVGAGDDADAAAPDADPDADPGAGPDADPDAAPDAEPDASVVNDPLCPDGLACEDRGSGLLGCLDHGEFPQSAPTNCGSTGCSGNQACRYVDDTKTDTVCVQNCGICSSGTACVDVTGSGYLGCLVEGYPPANATYACHGSSEGCPGNASCFFLDSEHTLSVCIEHCSEIQVVTVPPLEPFYQAQPSSSLQVSATPVLLSH